MDLAVECVLTYDLAIECVLELIYVTCMNVLFCFVVQRYCYLVNN